MLIKECPLCGCKSIIDIPEIGCKCSNCEEIFKYDERFELLPVSLEEWKDYLDRAEIH